MKLVVGLGNPGREYEGTRHNVGWLLLDYLARRWDLESARRDGDARVADARVGNTRVRLIKPLTYMNLSGQVLRPYQRRDGWSAASDLLVVVDEVALALGRYRLRAQGSAGGHNGLRSVEAALGTREYARLRIGIRPADPQREIADLSDFVLAPFGKSERGAVDELLPKLADAVEIWVRDGIVAAMNKHNRRPSAPNEDLDQNTEL
ncbi:MAG: aminoacyl-tRNA hydrolase [Gemmatimonadaceae bacterium]